MLQAITLVTLRKVRWWYVILMHPLTLLDNRSHLPAFNAFTDGALVLTPVFMIMSLHTTRRAKWFASALLGFSSIACGAAVWRTIELDEIFAADWDFTRKHRLPLPLHCMIESRV
jgi:hypothetical protein